MHQYLESRHPLNDFCTNYYRQLQDGQVIGLKTLADVVEALIGVYFLHGGMDSALKAMNWLRVPIPFPEKVPEVVYTNVEEKMRTKSSFSGHDIATLEKKIAYRFKCKSLLVSAFDFGDEVIFNDAGAARGSFEFQRLEFLGEVTVQLDINVFLSASQHVKRI
jgi:endoribonuclease Dicer